MAKVLVVESDSVFAAVFADRLHVAGHEVRRLADGARAAAAAHEPAANAANPEHRTCLDTLRTPSPSDVPAPAAQDWRWIGEIVEQYATLPLEDCRSDWLGSLAYRNYRSNSRIC